MCPMCAPKWWKNPQRRGLAPPSEVDERIDPLQTVLIIDDSPTIRYLLKVYLAGLAVTVLEASDGAAGLRQVREGGVSLVIADLRMPGVDGFEFIRQLRADATHGRLPVILLTMEAEPGLKEEALALGANAFLTKPVPLAVLRETVQQLLSPVSP